MNVFKGALVASAAVLVVSGANAGEIRLSDAVLDNVTAGQCSGSTCFPGNSFLATLLNEPGLQSVDDIAALDPTDFGSLPAAVGGGGTIVGQAGALLAFGIRSEFEQENPGQTPPPQLSSILGFLEQVAIDRGVSLLP